MVPDAAVPTVTSTVAPDEMLMLAGEILRLVDGSEHCTVTEEDSLLSQSFVPLPFETAVMIAPSYRSLFVMLMDHVPPETVLVYTVSKPSMYSVTISPVVPVPSIVVVLSNIELVVIVGMFELLFPMVIELESELSVPPVMVALAVMTSPADKLNPVIIQLPFASTVELPCDTPDRWIVMVVPVASVEVPETEVVVPQ